MISLFLVCDLCSKEFHSQVGVESKIAEVKLLKVLMDGTVISRYFPQVHRMNRADQAHPEVLGERMMRQ